MRGIKEEDLDLLKLENLNRLSPARARGFLIGAFIYTSIFMGIVFYTFSLEGSYIFYTSFQEAFARIEMVLYILQCILLLPFLFLKGAFKFQKLQSVVVLFFSFQMATLPFIFLLVEGIFGISYNTKTLIYFFVLLIGAVFTFIVSVIDTFKEVERGGYRLSEDGIIHFTRVKVLLMLVMAPIVVILLILIAFSIGFNGEGVIFYCIQTTLLYCMAIASGELMLMAYCRFKFPAFNITQKEYKEARNALLNILESIEQEEEFGEGHDK